MSNENRKLQAKDMPNFFKAGLKVRGEEILYGVGVPSSIQSWQPQQQSLPYGSN